MEAEEFSAWAPVVADVLFYTYYSILTLGIGSIAACCISSTIRTACIAKVVSLVLWRLERKQVRGTRRGSVVSKNADGFVCVQHVDWCNLLSPQYAAALCKNLPYEVLAFRVESLRFRVPNLSRWKFELVVDGCDVQIRQKAMPSQGRQRKVPSAANPGVLKEKARRLALVDMLLWDFNPETESSKERNSSGMTHAWLASVVHAVTSICMRAVSCYLTDITLMLFQDTVPGPWQGTASSAGGGHREGISCHVRMVSHGPVEVRGGSGVVVQRNKRMAIHENSWFKTFVPAPVSDMLASVEQCRQVQLSVEGVSVSVHSTFKLSSTQQGAQNQPGGLNANMQAATATSAHPPVGSGTGAKTAASPVTQMVNNAQQGLGSTAAATGTTGTPSGSPGAATTQRLRVGTKAASNSQGEGEGQGSKHSYLKWEIDQPILQNWGCSISLLSTPAKPRRDQRKPAANNSKSSKRAGAADAASKLAPEDSMHGSVSPPPTRSMNRDLRRTSFLARIPESAERAKVSNSFVGLPSPAVHSHFRTRSSLIQRSSTAVHYLPARTPGTMGPLRGAFSGGPSFKHVLSERGESSAESAATEADKVEEPPEGLEATDDVDDDSGCNTSLHVEVKLRALVPTADAHVLAVLSRVALRTHLYTAMEANWAARPKTDVKADPRAWWRHAALRVLQECSRVRRRRTALFTSSRQHRIHKRYRVLYLRLHESNASYRDPNRKWWQVWKYFLRAREPSLSLAREELGLLDQDLALEEIIYLRMKYAMVHSDHLKNNEYATRVVQLLNLLKINPHSPLHKNEEAVMRGRPVLPPFGSSSFPVRISASVTIPRVGFNIHVERPEPCVLSGEISKCCATLHTQSRFLFTVETAVLQTSVQPTAGSKVKESTWGTVILQAPCASFALLHHSDPNGTLRASRLSAGPTAPQPFLLFSFKPPGVAETQAETQAHIKVKDTLQDAKGRSISKSITANGLPEYESITPAGSLNEDQARRQHDERASGGFSARASLNLSDMSHLRESMKSSLQYDAAERTQVLQDRIEHLRGDVVFGSAMARVAPVEAFVDSTSLVCLLELGLQLRTLVHDGDCLMKRVAGCGSTVEAALSGGTLPDLVHGSLVKHRIAVQGMSPPVFPSLSVTCGGLVLRLGMLGQSDNRPKNPDTLQQAPSPHSTDDPHPDDVHPREYEFIVSVIDVTGAIGARLDTEQHTSARVCYDMCVHFDVEAGFKQGSISSLLQEADLAQIKEVHEAAVLSWMHPADDEAILRSLQDKQSRDTEYINQDQKLAMKEMFPHLMLDPGDGAFPLLPTFNIAGTAIRCTCVMPVAPSVAGNLNLAATGRPNGISISISPDHLKLIRHLVKDVDDVFKSVQHRASSIISADQASNGNPSQVPGLAVPKSSEGTDATGRESNAFNGSQSLAGNKHVTVALHVPIVTVLFFAPRSGQNSDARSPQWVRGVLDSAPDVYWSPQARDAALWADKVAPMADITVVDLRIGADLRGTASGSVCATVGGCLVTDLQAGAALPDSTMGGGIRFGPLPYRAQNLMAKATRERRHMCGLHPPKKDCIAVQRSAHPDLQAPMAMRGGERPETSRGRDRNRRESDALASAAAAATRPLSALSGPIHRMGISEISNCRSSAASRGWAAVRRSIFTSALFRQHWLQHWLHDRCALLLKSQVELTPTQDNSFTQWHNVYEKAMRVGSDSIPQMRVSIVAWADGQNDQNDQPGLQVDASVALQQLYMVGILQGNSRMTCYVSQLLEVIVPTLGSRNTKPPQSVQAPASPAVSAERAQERPVASNSSAAPLPMQMSVSFGVAAMQGTLRAGKKNFLESLTRDASCTVRLTIDPETAPAGELEVDAWVAEVRVEHATDILHKGILRMPAPEELVGAISNAAAQAIPHRRTGSEADGGDGYSSSDDADPPLPSDVCIHLAGKQQLFFEGSALSKFQPKSLWTVQAHKPMLTFQLHFLYDILYILQHVRGKYIDHFSKLHRSAASATSAHPRPSPEKVPSGTDVSGEPEIQPSASCARAMAAAEDSAQSPGSPNASPVHPTNGTAAMPVTRSLKTRSMEFPFEIQVVLTQGAVILPEKMTAEPGQERACIVSCDRVILGLPGATLNTINTGVTMDAGVMGDAAARSTMLPHVSSLLPSSARTLNRHCAMTQVVHDDVSTDSDHDADTADSHQHDNEAGEQVEGTGRLRNWLKRKIKNAMGIVEQTLHSAHTPSHAAAANKHSPDVTPTAQAQPVHVADAGAQTSGSGLAEVDVSRPALHSDAHYMPEAHAATPSRAAGTSPESSPNELNMCQRASPCASPVKTHVKFSERCPSPSTSPCAAAFSRTHSEDVGEDGSPSAASAAPAAAGATRGRSSHQHDPSSKQTHSSQAPMATGLETDSQALISFIAQGYQIHGCHVAKKYYGATSPQRTPGRTRSGTASSTKSSPGSTAGQQRQSHRVGRKQHFLTYKRLVPILTRGNLGFAFTLRNDNACHIHLASSPVWVCLSPASYWHIIDMCTGNFLEGSRLNPLPPPPLPNEFREYRPRVRMWPSASSKLLTSVTVTAARGSVVLQADPCIWEDGSKAGPIYSAPRVPFAQVESTDFALSVVVAVNKNKRIETYILADVQAAHTYDLRLARFHLLRKPWMAQMPRNSIPEEAPPVMSATGGLNGRMPSIPQDEEVVGGAHVPPRSPSKIGASLRAGSVAQGSVTIGGGYEGSRGGENGESTPPPLIYMDDLYNTGVLYTSSQGKEYSSVLTGIERLPRSDQSEMSTVPLVHLGSAPVFHRHVRSNWAAHLPDDYSDTAALSCGFCVLGDRTMALDLDLRHFQTMWPWLVEISMLTSVLSIFVPPERGRRGTVIPRIQPWFYINIVLEHFQALVPLTKDVLEVDNAVTQANSLPVPEAPSRTGITRGDSLLHWRHLTSSMHSAQERVSKAVIERPGVFQLMAQAMLNRLADTGDLKPLHRYRRDSSQTLFGTPFLTDAPVFLKGGNGSRPGQRGPGQFQRPAQLILPVEEGSTVGAPEKVPSRAFMDSAIVFTTHAIRYGQFFGDDGKTIMKADIWNAAGHVSHPDACVECWLLPCSLELELHERTRLVEEQRRLQLMTEAAIKIQKWWRQKKIMLRLEQRGILPNTSGYGDLDRTDSESMLAAWGTTSRLGGGQGSLIAVPPESTRIIDDLIYRRLSPADRARVDKLHKQQESTLDLGLPREPCEREVKVKIHNGSVRVAISHLNMHRLVRAHFPVMMNALTGLPSQQQPPSDSRVDSTEPSQAFTTGAFRQTTSKVHISIDEASLWLCMDGSQSFGAPDVMQASLNDVVATSEIELTQADVAPTVRAMGSLRTCMRFLDNSTSNWQWMLYPWMVQAEYLYARPNEGRLTDNEPAQVMSIDSRQNAIILFTPACLLTIGDVLAYVNALLRENDKNDVRNTNTFSTTQSVIMPGYQGYKGRHQRPPRPDMREQMALSMQLTERLPQRYCIQNHLGISCWYWAPSPGSHASMTKHELPPGDSQQMRCDPRHKEVIMEQAEGGRARKKMAVISLLVEGNWLPVSNVAVGQVGKYRYSLYSPHDNATLYIVADIQLVGRTKVVSLHSSVWLENGTDVALKLRLHVPPSLLVVAPQPALEYEYEASLRTDSGLSPAPSASSLPKITRNVGPTPVPGSSRSLGAGASGSLGQAPMHAGHSGTHAPGLSRRASSRRLNGPGAAAREWLLGASDINLRTLLPGEGMYLPLAAMLNGTVYFTPEGHHENLRDVLRLSNDVSQLHSQQGYLQCRSATPVAHLPYKGGPQGPSPPPAPAASLTHFFMKVSASKAHEEHSAALQFTQVSVDSSGWHPAHFRPVKCNETAIVANVTIQPTCVFTNSLPFPAQVTFIEAWYEKNAVSGKAKSEPAHTNTPTFVSKVRNASVMADSWSMGLPREQALVSSLLGSSSPIHAHATAGNRVTGRHVQLCVDRGASVNLYADQNRTILAYMEVPYIQMHTESWFVVNWGLADLGPMFDPLNIQAKRTRRAAAAGVTPPKKPVELPRVLHLVPHERDVHERRRRVFRRVRNFITRGVCIGGDLPHDFQSRSTNTRTPALQTNDKDKEDAAATTHKGTPQDPSAAGSTLRTQKLTTDHSVQSNHLRSQALTAAHSKSTVLEEEGEHADDCSDASDAEPTPCVKSAKMARTSSQSRSMAGALQDEDADATKILKRVSGSHGTDSVVPRNVGGEVQNTPGKSPSTASSGGSEATSVVDSTKPVPRCCTLAQTPQRRLLMSAFEAWRYAKVSKGQRAPQSLYLGVANSGRARHGQVGRRHSCEITVYSHFWVVNSSRSPLFFWDVPQDSSSDFLDSSSMMAPGSVYAFKTDGKSDNQLMLLPCLLNRQSKIRFCVPAHYSSGASRLGEASKPINISVVGLQSDKISLKGPEFPRPPKQQTVVTEVQGNPTVVADDEVSRVASLVHSPGRDLARVPRDSPGLPEGSRSSVVAGGSISVASVPSGASVTASAALVGHQESCGNLRGHRGGTLSAPAPTHRSSDGGGMGMGAAAAGMSISLRFPGDPIHIETPTDLPAGASSFGFLTSPSVTSRSPASHATPGGSLACTSAQPITPRMGQSREAPSSGPRTAASTPCGEDWAEVVSPANGGQQRPLSQSTQSEITAQEQHNRRSSLREELREETLREREFQEQRSLGNRSTPPPQVQAEFSGTGSHNTSDGHTASTPIESWLQARPAPREWLNGASTSEFISSVPSADVSILQTDELMEAEPPVPRVHSPADRAPHQGVTLASAKPAVLAELSPQIATAQAHSGMRRTSSATAAISPPTGAASRSSSTENVPSSLTPPLDAVFSPISPNGQQQQQHKTSPKARLSYPRRAPSPLRESSSLGGSLTYSPRSPLENQGAVSAVLSSRDKAQSVGARTTAAAEQDLTLRPPTALRLAQREAASNQQPGTPNAQMGDSKALSQVRSASLWNGATGAMPSARSADNLSDGVSPPAGEASLRHPSETSPASSPHKLPIEAGASAPGDATLPASHSTSAFQPGGVGSPHESALVAHQQSKVSEIQPAPSSQSLQQSASSAKIPTWAVYDKICRQHEFAVEVVSGSAHSCFSFTKMVHIKDKYIIENRTGEVLDIKQRTTPDPGLPFGPEGIKRSACQLPDGASTAFFWDDNTAPKSVVARLASDGPGQWEWSGGFALAEKEDYLGLRMHHMDASGVRDGQTVIVPVSIAVDSSKVVLVSFKSRQNLPPYKIRNSCAAVDIIVSQQVVSARPERLIPGQEVPFAWDEPMLGHKLVITAVMRNADPDPEAHRATSVLEIDKGMPSKIAPLVVKARAGRRTTGTELTAQNRSNSTQDLKSRFNLEGALARSVERKVQIEIFADGPTRIVRCSDTDTTSALEGTIVSTMHRIHDAEHRLLVTNQRFAALRGGNGISRLDLFGAAERRTGTAAAAQDWPTPRASAPALTEFSPARPAENPLGPSSEANSPQHPAATALVAAGSVSTAVAMMTAGNLLVTVHGLREKDGGNLLVRLAVGDQKQQTNVHWGSDATEWNEEINFYQVDAAKELHAEVRDVIGRYSNIKSKYDPEKVLEKSSVFVGEARVPLAETLPGFMTRTSNNFGGDNSDGGDTGTQKREFVLARRHGGDLVSGYITLSFEWTITAASLLKQKLRVLEQVLTTRNEILSILAPRPIERTEISHNLTGTRGPGGLARASVAGSFDDRKSLRCDEPKWTLEARRRYFDVSVSVLEVHNVPPRKGLGAAITANDAPLPSVTVSVGSQQRSWIADTRGTQATFRTVRHTFENIPARTDLKVTVYDHVNSNAPEQHGAASIPLNGLDLTNPVYMWLEAPACQEDIDLRQSRAHNAMFRAVSDGAGAVKAALGVGGRGVQPESFELEEAPVEHIQLRVRLEAVPLDTAGPSVAANLRLAGGGVLLSSGLEEELLASSFSDLQVTMEFGQSEASIHATIQTLQIDDQSLDAQQPVVLGPASAVSKGLNRVGDHVKHPVAYGLLDPGHNVIVGDPLVRLTVIRSFAHKPNEGHPGVQRSPGLKAQRGHQALVGGVGSDSNSLDPMSSVNEVLDSAPASSIGSILSFKQVSLELGPVDFTAHENFLTSVFNFAQQLPLEDVSQDEEWQKRSREAINSIAVGYTARRAQQAVVASQCQLAELAAYHRPTGRNDSVLGSWFFIEKFTISNIHSNVTINLSSNIVAKAQLLKVQAGVDADGRDKDDPSVEASTGFGSQFLHLVQSSGFQLINVNNVAIQLKGKELHSSLLSTKSVIAMLIRHYFEQAVMEAHKVLGGTGPAIAQIPLTVLWTGGTLFDLTVDLASRRAGALSALPRMGFITFTASAQLIGVASKMAAALMAVLPYHRDGDYSDAAAVARYVVRPQHAVEAFSMATRALFQGLVAALVGVVSDPYAGFKHGNVPGLAVGTAKGILGLGLRPLGGFSEFCSKSSQGLALVCLGRQGIQGRTMRRVYAPGITRRLHGHEGGHSVEVGSHTRQRRMWEQTLPQLSPKFNSDALLYAVTVRRGRVLLLSDRHVIYCKARYYSPDTFRLRWYLDVENINNVLGDEGKLTVLVRAASVVQLPCAGTWRFPVTKKIRAASLEIFEKVATELNDQVTVPQFSRQTRVGDMWSASHHLPQLRITAGNDISRTTSVDSDDDD